jgi:hypothetical protein
MKFALALWTREMATKLIKEKFKITLASASRLGARQSARQSDRALVQQWLKEDYPLAGRGANEQHTTPRKSARLPTYVPINRDCHSSQLRLSQPYEKVT